MSKMSIASGAVVGATTLTSVVLTPGATVALDASTGSQFTLVPAQACTINANNVVNGDEITVVVVTSGATSYVVTFGTGFLTTGTLTTGVTTAKTFILKFQAVNGALTEVSRTTAQ